jgi:hypothetical protein
MKEAPAHKIRAKVDDCLRWAQIRTENRRDWLPECNLTPAYLLRLLQRQRLRCALTKVPLTLIGPQSATIDRINGKKGYRTRNVRWVAKFANSAKSTMTDDEFRKWWRRFKSEIRARRI